MSDKITFADNLYGGSTILRGGCGLIGFCRNGFWLYERHERGCKPGMWRVAVGGHEAGEFWPLLGEADAVVDDFGNLRRVES